MSFDFPFVRLFGVRSIRYYPYLLSHFYFLPVLSIFQKWEYLIFKSWINGKTPVGGGGFYFCKSLLDILNNFK